MDASSLKRKIKNNKFLFTIYIHTFGKHKARKKISIAEKTLQDEGFLYISQIEAALTEAKAKFFLNYGSLLGMMRSGSFIAWDRDIDYGIFIDESFTWEDLSLAMGKIGMKLDHQFRYDGMITEQTYKSDKLTVDFFSHNEADDYSYEYVYFRKETIQYRSIYEYSVSRSKLYKFPGIEKRQIGEVVFSAPINAEMYLSSLYTDDWRTPNPNWVSEKGPAWNEIPGAIGTIEYK